MLWGLGGDVWGVVDSLFCSGLFFGGGKRQRKRLSSTLEAAHSVRIQLRTAISSIVSDLESFKILSESRNLMRFHRCGLGVGGEGKKERVYMINNIFIDLLFLR